MEKNSLKRNNMMQFLFLSLCTYMLKHHNTQYNICSKHSISFHDDITLSYAASVGFERESEIFTISETVCTKFGVSQKDQILTRNYILHAGTQKLYDTWCNPCIIIYFCSPCKKIIAKQSEKCPSETVPIKYIQLAPAPPPSPTKINLQLYQTICQTSGFW